MRHSHIIAACLLAAVTLAPYTTFAAGNVLLPSGPSSSGNNSSLPNLGLLPSPSATTTPPAAQPSSPNTGIQSTPITHAPVNIQRSDVVTPIDPNALKNLPAGSFPTQVVHMPDMTDPMPSDFAPNTLNVSISSKSVLSAQDMQTVSNKFGLSRDQIINSCLISVRGNLNTNKGSYPIGGGTTSQFATHYDGSIKSYMMVAQALCVVNQLPPTAGSVIEVGNRYVVSLQQVSCNPPNQQVSGLTITYNGGGASQCTYN